MPVGVDRDLNRGVTEESPHVIEVLAGLQQISGVGMPHIVIPDPREFCGFENRMESSADIAWV